jgi:NaMN:DMB phosphoribosyltransferase
MKDYLQTVTGPVAREDMGLTLPHEHLFNNLSSVVDAPCYPFSQRLVDKKVTAEIQWALKHDPYCCADNMDRKPIEDVVGIGANLPTDKLANKIDVVRRAITLNQPNPQDGVNVLAKVGGFDLVGMAGVMLGAASCGLPVLLDGFLSYAAALAACQMSPAIKPYLIPSHLSAEKGARIALSHLGLEPFLNMDMRLGEGSGAALAMPIIEAACAIYNNMGELAASKIVLPGNTTSDLNS